MAHDRRADKDYDKWVMGVVKIGGEGRKLGGGGGGFGLLHIHVSSNMKQVTKISHRQTYCRTFLFASVGVPNM